MFADVLGLPIDVIDGKELGAQGAAMAAGIAAGVYRDYEEATARTVRVSKTVLPRPEYKAVYDQKYAAYCALTQALRGVWGRLENQ